MKSKRLSSSLLLLSLLSALMAACASEPEGSEPALECEDRARLGGVCPGVTSAAVSREGIACAATIEVNAPSDLDAKLATATSGACVVLGEGAFPAITLPPGVSLIGHSAAKTTLAGLQATGAAEPATARGLTITGGGVSLSGSGAFTLDRVVVSASESYGVEATDVDLTVTTSRIAGNKSFGLLVDCKDRCDGARPALHLRSVMVSDNQAVGVWAHGVSVTLEGVQIEKTKPQKFFFGRGLEIAGGASLKAKNLAVVDNLEVGILIDSGSAELINFTSRNNLRGVQLQAIPASGARLEDFAIVDNAAIGIGVSNGSQGIIVQGGRVASTRALKVPVDIGGAHEVGDGINWLDGSEVTVGASVTIESSARRPVIIDADSKGKFEGAMSGGDETLGIIVQGGREASMPAGLAVASGLKTDVLTKDQAVPVALAIPTATKSF